MPGPKQTPVKALLSWLLEQRANPVLCTQLLSSWGSGRAVRVRGVAS